MDKRELKLKDMVKIITHREGNERDDFGMVGRIIKTTDLYSFEGLNNGDEIEHKHMGYMIEAEDGAISNWYRNRGDLEFISSYKDYLLEKILKGLNESETTPWEYKGGEFIQEEPRDFNRFTPRKHLFIRTPFRIKTSLLKLIIEFVEEES